jgi:hypothetical protein
VAAWNELLIEANSAGSIHDILRRKYLRRLSQYTKRNTILYYSGWLQKPELLQEKNLQLGIGDADKNGFMSAIYKMDRSKGLDILLHTPGGDMAATESIIDYLRAMFTDIRAIVPQIAMSGGTIIALSCSKILMGKGSSIGPIDPQFGPMSATSLLTEFEKIRSEIQSNPANALLWEPVLRKLDPGFITDCQNALTWSKSMADRYLKTGMFAGDADADAKVDQVIAHLTENKKTLMHGRHISLEEARSIFGDHVAELEGDQRLQDLVLSVHHSTIITLQSTAAYKLIENDKGRAFVLIAQPQIVAVR